MKRVHNPEAEMPLKRKIGKWLRVERHVFYQMIRDETACYVKKGERWGKYV